MGRVEPTASDDAPADITTSAGADSLREAAERRKRLAEIDVEIKACAAAERKLKSERADLEEQVLEDLIELGTDSMRTDLDDGTRRTVRIDRTIWAGAPKTGEKDGEPVTTDEDWKTACDALRTAGLDYLVGERFNSQSLSSYMREFAKEHGPGWRDKLPPELEVLRIDDKPVVRTRKA